MASSINVSTDNGRSATLFRAEGLMSADEIMNAIRTYYALPETQDVIWDFCRASLSELSPEALSEIATTANTYSTHRRTARTIFVADKLAEKTLINLYTTLAEILDTPIAYHVVADFAAVDEILAGSDDHTRLALVVE